MKKILFIIPGLKTGGTNSSLNSLVNSMSSLADICVFTLSYHDKNQDYSFEEKLIKPNATLSLLCTNYKNLRGGNLLLCITFKVISRLLKIAKFDLYDYYFRRFTNKIEKEYKPDFVVAYEEGISTQFVSFFTNTPKIAWIHCNYDKYLPPGLSEEHIYGEFYRIVCVSKYTAGVFSRRYPSFADRTITIYNLVDISRIEALSLMDIEDNRFRKDRKVILSVGRFNRVKRFSYIPRIASSLKQQGLLFYWYIIGPQTTDSDYEDFSKNLIEYDVADCVIWLGPKSNPYPYFRLSDLYVCLSESEACPMVFIEASVCKLKVVTTDFPSASEFINDIEGTMMGDISNMDSIIVNSLSQSKCINGKDSVLIHNDMETIKNLFSL